MTREQAEQRFRDKVDRKRRYAERVAQEAKAALEDVETMLTAKESYIAYYEALP